MLQKLKCEYGIDDMSNSEIIRYIFLSAVGAVVMWAVLWIASAALVILSEV